VDRESRKEEERRPVEEAGGGEAEGFEQAEEALREAAEHGDERNPEADAYEVEAEAARAGDSGGEADHVKSSERDEREEVD
jgi:hypothetical protein